MEAKRIVIDEEKELERKYNITDNKNAITATPASDYFYFYQTLQKRAGSIRTKMYGYISIQIATEVRVLQDRNSNSREFVSYGYPYAFAEGQFVGFEHGGFINTKINSRSFRTSAVGAFVMNASVGIGFQIVSVGINGTVRSEVITATTVFMCFNKYVYSIFN